jgi:hypothetical protein
MDEETTTNYCIVTKSASGPVALVGGEDSRLLPVVTLTSDIWPPEQAAEINGQLMDHHGLNCTLLRWLENRGDTNILVTEWHPGSNVVEIDVEWMDPRSDDLPLPPEQLEMIRNWLRSSSGNLVPWERPGWMKEVVFWLLRIFNGVNRPGLTNLAQVKAGWGMSTLLLIETSEADYYFKAGTRLGIEEWRLLKRLHGKFPGRIPDPLVVNEQNNWMVLRKIDHMPYPPRDFDGLCGAFRAYAEIQLGCAEWRLTGEVPGLRVKDAAWMRSRADAFISADRVPEVFSELKSALGDTELAALTAAWRRDIEGLAAAKLPLTLNNEDLHFQNILNTAGGPVLIDWADCVMTHPFFSLHRILALWGVELSEDERQEREEVHRAYLDVFRRLVDEDQLRHEVAITERLWKLYQAFRWQNMAETHRDGSRWGEICRRNAIRDMTAAVQQALA